MQVAIMRFDMIGDGGGLEDAEGGACFAQGLRTQLPLGAAAPAAQIVEAVIIGRFWGA